MASRNRSGQTGICGTLTMAFRLVARNMMTRLPTLQTAQRVGLFALPRLQGFAPSGPVSALRPLGVNQRCGRSFAVSAVGNSPVDKELSEVLAAEIKHERENNDPTTQDIDPPGDWILTEQPGESIVTLSRKHNGENILVEFSVNGQPDVEEQPQGAEEDEAQVDQELDEADIDMAISFDVSIIKGKQSLDFEMRTDGTYVEIQHVSIGSSETAPDETAYDGPLFAELDPELQKQFQDYIAERQIDTTLGNYMMTAADVKEEKEYIRWLGEVKSFVDASSA